VSASVHDVALWRGICRALRAAVRLCSHGWTCGEPASTDTGRCAGSVEQPFCCAGAGCCVAWCVGPRYALLAAALVPHSCVIAVGGVLSAAALPPCAPSDGHSLSWLVAFSGTVATASHPTFGRAPSVFGAGPCASPAAARGFPLAVEAKQNSRKRVRQARWPPLALSDVAAPWRPRERSLVALLALLHSGGQDSAVQQVKQVGGGHAHQEGECVAPCGGVHLHHLFGPQHAR
jgi:hypothetical protein